MPVAVISLSLAAAVVASVTTTIVGYAAWQFISQSTNSYQRKQMIKQQILQAQSDFAYNTTGIKFVYVSTTTTTSTMTTTTATVTTATVTTVGVCIVRLKQPLNFFVFQRSRGASNRDDQTSSVTDNYALYFDSSFDCSQLAITPDHLPVEVEAGDYSNYSCHGDPLALPADLRFELEVDRTTGISWQLLGSNNSNNDGNNNVVNSLISDHQQLLRRLYSSSRADDIITINNYKLAAGNTLYLLRARPQLQSQLGMTGCDFVINNQPFVYRQVYDDLDKLCCYLAT